MPRRPTDQAVVVKKTHPHVRTRHDAFKVAAQEAGLKPGETFIHSRETGSSYRFRVNQTSAFQEGSLRTTKSGNHISRVVGTRPDGS